jgi:hypothetical protein
MASAKKHDGPRILTANTLLSGRSVFWTADGWERSAENAIRASTPEEVSELEARGQIEEMMSTVVGAYLVPLKDGQPVAPVELRERRRIAGPSINLPGAAAI